MQSSGKGVAVKIEPLSKGDGDNTLVWVPGGLNPSISTVPAAPAEDVTTEVTISNVLINGVAQTFSYNVTAFDPARAGGDTVLTNVQGPAAITAGTAQTYTFNTIPGATSYRWRAAAVSSLPILDTAASGAGNVTVSPANAAVATKSPLDEITPCYQLTNDPPTTITLNETILPAAGSTLEFSDLVGYATATEQGQVQISTDGGLVWADLFDRPASGGAPEMAFTARSVPLGAYAGLQCNLRFVYSATGTYYAFSTGTGWFVKNISITGAQHITGIANAGTIPAGAHSLAFTAPQAGVYALEVVPIFYGRYPDLNLTGPTKFATAVPGL